MRLLPILAGLTLVGLPSCTADQEFKTNTHDHWSSQSIGPRIGRAFLNGYDRENDGSYDQFQWDKKQEINLTMRRHLLNQNPENPFQPPTDYYKGARKPDNTLTRPVTYSHVEGLVIGACLYAGGAAFIPIPIDSILGSIEHHDEAAAKKRQRVSTTSGVYDELPAY